MGDGGGLLECCLCPATGSGGEEIGRLSEASEGAAPRSLRLGGQTVAKRKEDRPEKGSPRD